MAFCQCNKSFGCLGQRDAVQVADPKTAGRDGVIQRDGKQTHRLQRLCKFADDTGNPHAHAGIVMEQIVGAQLNFCINSHTVFKKMAVNPASGIGNALEHNQRLGGQLMQGDGAIAQVGKRTAGNKDILQWQAGLKDHPFGADGHIHKADVQLSAAKKLDGFGGGTVGDAEGDLLIHGVKFFNTGQQEPFAGGISRPDAKLPGAQLLELLHLPLARTDQCHRGANIAPEHLPLVRERDTPLAAQKELCSQCLLQLLHSKADGRLADIEASGRPGKAACPGYRVKYPIPIQIDVHNVSP